MKTINFSLWGSNPIYCIGMIKNCKLAEKFYPDWRINIWYKDVPNEILIQLKQFPYVFLFASNSVIIPNMMWRFLQVPRDYDAMIVRDADSRFSERESLAVKEWLESGKTLHSMHDHPCHGGYGILGGMWGIRQTQLNMFEEMKKWIEKNRYHIQDFNFDMQFLNEVIYQRFKDDVFTHDSCYTHFPNSHKFPIPMNNYCFIGEKWYDNDTPFYQRQDWIGKKEVGY
jgi:hypothetical protein